MKFICKKRLFDCECDSAIVAFYQKEKGDLQLPSWASDAKDEFLAKLGQISIVRNVRVESKKFRKVLLLGLGEKKKLGGYLAAAHYASAFNYLKNAGSKSIAISLGDLEFVSQIASSIEMANYSFVKYMEQKENEKREVESVCFVCKKDVSPEVERAKIMGKATNLSRSLQNEPGNIATPEYIATFAQKIAKQNGLVCKVLGKKELQKEKMNAMLAVGGGSAHEPKLVVLKYTGNPNSKEIDLAIVGKGVTFDSGGISLKPSPSMVDMKFDKSAACSTIGVMSALSSLDVKKNVVGVAALVENMPGAEAYRPGDIVRASNSKTIEVLNTDAEGRVVLADALVFTCKKYKPKELIDMATLTGACVVALGDLAAGLMCTNDSMSSKLIECGQACTERLWRLPHWAEYDEKVKSDLADVKNIGEKGSAGTIAGYSFLKPFVDCENWAHIDIAGTSWIKSPKRGLSVGGTGFGTRLCLEYLLK